MIPLTVWRCVVVPSSCITKGPRTGSNGTSSCELPTATTTDLLLKWNNSWCWRRKPSHVPWFLGMSEVQNEKSWFWNYFRDNSVHVRDSCCHVGDDESQCATIISQLKFSSDCDQWLNRCPTKCSENIEHHTASHHLTFASKKQQSWALPFWIPRFSVSSAISSCSIQ